MRKLVRGLCKPLSLVVTGFAAVCFVSPAVIQAQKIYFPPQPMPTETDAGGQISVQGMEITGGPLTVTINTNESGLAKFPGLIEGEYIVEVSAPGYRTVTEDAEIRVSV